MHRKQKVYMWLGIAAVVLPAIITILDGVGGFYRWVFIWVLITGGLIITFQDRKEKKPKDINWKRGFKRITLLISLLAYAAYIGIGIGFFIFKGDVVAFCAGQLFCLAICIGVWVVYGIIRWGIIPIVLWVVKGFRDNKPKDEQKE